MAGIAALLEVGAPASEATVRTMLDAAAHRGMVVRTAVCGGAVLGISEHPGRAEASLAANATRAAAVVGVVDHPDDTEPAALLVEVQPERLAATVERWRGMFAGVVTDGQRLWGFRDHVGHEPLFFRHEPGRVLVGSEAKQVLTGAGLPRRADPDVLEAFFYGAYGDETGCALAGVQRLPKATLGVLGPDGPRWRRYWSPAALLETARLGVDEAAEGFRERMATAVARAVTGNDVATLSGGIDSPAVAAFAAPVHRARSGRGLLALSQVFPDHPSVDERPYIEQVVADLDVEWRGYVPATPRLDTLGCWVQRCDGPWNAWSPDRAGELYELAIGWGRRTVLSGHLAEFVMDFSRGLVPHLVRRGRLRAGWRHLAQQRADGKPLARLAVQVGAPFVPDVLKRAWRGSPVPDSVPVWVDRARLAAARAAGTPALGEVWASLQLAPLLHGPGLSVEASALCQAYHGVRERLPWTDVDLWEFFLSLPAEVKYPTTQRKGFVRQALRGVVPDAVLDRTDKTVFDEFELAGVDYPALRAGLIGSDYRMPGVDYPTLVRRLETEALSPAELIWAEDLLAVHLFVAGTS